MRKREPAMPVMIRDILLSTEESNGDEDGPRSRHITPTGANLYRGIISGVLMEKADIGSESSPLLRLRIADPTGGLSFTVGRFNPGLVKDLEDIPVPSFITVIGRVSRFVSRNGERVVTLNPEIIVRSNKDERDRWHLLAVRDAIARIWKMEGRGPLPARYLEVPEPSDPRGGEETVEAANGIIRDTLMILDRSRFLKEIEQLKEKGSSTEEEVDDLEQYEDQVIAMITDLDTGDGARWDDLVDLVEKKRLSRNIIEEVISNLLDKGMLYEPVLGYLKAV